MTDLTVGALKAMQAAELAATVKPMGTRYRAMRDLAVTDANGQRVDVKRGELLTLAFLRAPRVNVQKLLGARQVRAEYVELESKGA